MADLVKKSGTLKLHSEINDIIARVSLLIKEIPEFSSLKLNHDLCVYALNLVTNMVKSKTIDVEAIVLQVMTKVFHLNEQEQSALQDQITYLQSSGAVQKISNMKLLYNAIKKSYKMIKSAFKNYISNTLQNRFIPYTIYSNSTQVLTYIILSKLGIQMTTTIILLFL